MKYAILPLIVFLTVMVLAASTQHKKHPEKDPELAGEWKGTYSVNDGPLVNDIIFDFIKGQLLLVFDGAPPVPLTGELRSMRLTDSHYSLKQKRIQ